ncbi:MAG: hypothetical protein A2Z17_03665 [Gammaproteobacteria bacterium RBG_16_66_13]|nr:MAG: hypothetical protein A2Z17_03665 [Gammaproteobacteria bacterium RBG_16_66_13]
MMKADEEALDKVTAVFKTERGKSWDEWIVLEMRVRYRLDLPYSGQVEIGAPTRNFDFSCLLGRSCALVTMRGKDREQAFKGVVFGFKHVGEFERGSVARLDFAPALWALRHGRDTRAFENRTAPQIIEEVLKEALAPLGRKVRLNLTHELRSREYRTQQDESDWDFVARLMQEEGITFYFDQGKEDTDKETIVLVDSNHAFPEIVTMGSVQELAAAVVPLPVPAKKKARFSAKVVDGATGEPIPGVKLELQLVDGSKCDLVSGSDGTVEVPDVVPGHHTLSGAIGGLTMKNALELVSVGDSPGSASGGGASSISGKTTRAPPTGAASATPYRVVGIERYKVKRGDTLAKIAAKNDLDRAMLAYFNWGVYSPSEVEEKLRDEVGCTQKDPNGRYVLTDEDEPGIIFIPKPWRAGALGVGREHVVRVRPIAARFALYVDEKRNPVRGRQYRIFEAGREVHAGFTDSDGWMTAPFVWSERYELHFDEEPTTEGS